MAGLELTESEKLQHRIWDKIKRSGLPAAYIAIKIIPDPAVVDRRLKFIAVARERILGFNNEAPAFVSKALKCLDMMTCSEEDFVEFYGELNIALAELGASDTMQRKGRLTARGDCGAPIGSATCFLRRGQRICFCPKCRNIANCKPLNRRRERCRGAKNPKAHVTLRLARADA